MLALTVELLTGRYTATTFNDRDSAEWPPHPARLFSALVAAWADDDEPPPDGRDALQWLEAQQPPDITCDPLDAVVHRQVVTHFVPVNDASALSRDVGPSSYVDLAESARQLAAVVGLADTRAVRLRAGAQRLAQKARAAVTKAAAPTGGESAPVISAVRRVLPEERIRQPRTFPTVRPTHPRFAFLWRDAEPEQPTFDALERLASRVGRLGHSSSLVTVQAVRSVDIEPTYSVDSGGDLALRVPRAGLLDALDRQFSVHRGMEPRTLPNAVARYRQGRRPTARMRPLLGGDWIVLGLPSRSEQAGPQPRIRLTRTLDVARAVRGALLVHGPQPAPDFLTGHSSGSPAGPQRNPSSDGSPAAGQPHLAVVPLPDVASQHSGGVIQAVALVFPVDCVEPDRRAVIDAVSAWGSDGRRLALAAAGPAGRPVVVDLDEPVIDPVWGGLPRTARTPGLATTRRSFWCRPSATWTTATPIALDRFPGDLRARDGAAADEATAAAEAVVARSCVLAGLPEPIAVAVSTTGFLAAVPPSGSDRRDRAGARFPGYAAGGSGQRRVTVHARITFAEAVDGPVLVGAGRYLGYGLCLPTPGPNPGPGR